MRNKCNLFKYEPKMLWVSSKCMLFKTGHSFLIRLISLAYCDWKYKPPGTCTNWINIHSQVSSLPLIPEYLEVLETYWDTEETLDKLWHNESCSFFFYNIRFHNDIILYFIQIQILDLKEALFIWLISLNSIFENVFSRWLLDKNFLSYVT